MPGLNWNLVHNTDTRALRCGARMGKRGRTRCERPALHTQMCLADLGDGPYGTALRHTLQTEHCGRDPGRKWRRWPATPPNPPQEP